MTAVCLDPGKLPQCAACLRNRQPAPGEFAEALYPKITTAPDTNLQQCISFRAKVELDV